MQQPIKFLVVCKDPGESRDLRGMLSSLGHDVLTVTDGEQALALLGTDREIGWVISGIKLGGKMDGFKLTEAIRNMDNPVRLPIFIILSDYSAETRNEYLANLSLAKSLGASDVLVAPVRQEALLTRVGNYLLELEKREAEAQ